MGQLFGRPAAPALLPHRHGRDRPHGCIRCGGRRDLRRPDPDGLDAPARHRGDGRGRRAPHDPFVRRVRRRDEGAQLHRLPRPQGQGRGRQDDGGDGNVRADGNVLARGGRDAARRPALHFLRRQAHSVREGDLPQLFARAGVPAAHRNGPQPRLVLIPQGDDEVVTDPLNAHGGQVRSIANPQSGLRAVVDDRVVATPKLPGVEVLAAAAHVRVVARPSDEHVHARRIRGAHQHVGSVVAADDVQGRLPGVRVVARVAVVKRVEPLQTEGHHDLAGREAPRLVQLHPPRAHAVHPLRRHVRGHREGRPRAVELLPGKQLPVRREERHVEGVQRLRRGQVEPQPLVRNLKHEGHVPGQGALHLEVPRGSLAQLHAAEAVPLHDVAGDPCLAQLRRGLPRRPALLRVPHRPGHKLVHQLLRLRRCGGGEVRVRREGRVDHLALSEVELHRHGEELTLRAGARRAAGQDHDLAHGEDADAVRQGLVHQGCLEVRGELDGDAAHARLLREAALQVHPDGVGRRVAYRPLAVEAQRLSGLRSEALGKGPGLAADEDGAAVRRDLFRLRHQLADPREPPRPQRQEVVVRKRVDEKGVGARAIPCRVKFFADGKPKGLVEGLVGTTLAGQWVDYRCQPLAVRADGVDQYRAEVDVLPRVLVPVMRKFPRQVSVSGPVEAQRCASTTLNISKVHEIAVSPHRNVRLVPFLRNGNRHVSAGN